MIEQWLTDIIVLSVIFGIIFLTLITCKGHDLCHKEKKIGILFLFISLNFFGLFWACKIYKKQHPEFKFWLSVKQKVKRKKEKKKNIKDTILNISV